MVRSLVRIQPELLSDEKSRQMAALSLPKSEGAQSPLEPEPLLSPFWSFSSF